MKLSNIDSDAFCCSVNDLHLMTSCKELHQSCKEYGYFFITCTDAEVFNLDSVFAEGAQFFSLPESEKLKNTASSANQFLGYRRLGTEKSVLTGDPELCEQYKFGYFYEKKTNSSNLLCDYLSTYESIFKKYTKSYFNSMEQLATKLLMIIAENFSLGKEHFKTYCDQPMHQLGINYYPTGNANEQSTQNYAMSAHKDLCLLTIIAQNQGGLMVKNLQDEWSLIPNRPNTLLVLLGDYLERWTNGYYLAPVHRVLESSKNARISVIYKHRPNYETIIPLIPGINPERKDVDAAFHTGKAYEEKINYIMSASYQEA